MRTIVTAASLIVGAVLSVAPFAHADDQTHPNYQIDGGGQPGVEHLPKICGDFPWGCALRYQPGPNTWVRVTPDEPEH
jgi:hypothetical protein